MTNSFCVVGLAALMLVIAACAATSPNAKPPATTAAQDQTCLKDTGSRMPPNNAGCRGVGRSYSKEDVDRTGATTADQALRNLDPSVTIAH
jgi:hypothetical protein